MERMRQTIVEKLRAGQRPSDIAREMNIARCTVYSAKKIFDATGGYSKRVAGGRPRIKRTRALIASIRAKVRRNSERSMRQLAKEAQVSEKTVRRVVKEDLGLVSRVKQPKQLVTAQQQEKRLERARRLENRLKATDSGKVIIFSDEKLFSVDRRAHRRNTRFLGPASPADARKLPPGDRFVYKTKHPASVMMLGVVASDGKRMPAVFIPNGTSVTSAVYIDLLKTKVIPWLWENYPDGQFVFQQDGAPAHTSRVTQAFLQSEIPFWPAGLWPPSSPDLNPLDYGIWTHVEARACARSHANVESLKCSIASAWTEMSSDFVQRVCKDFRRRLRRCIDAGGNIFE